MCKCNQGDWEKKIQWLESRIQCFEEVFRQKKMRRTITGETFDDEVAEHNLNMLKKNLTRIKLDHGIG